MIRIDLGSDELKKGGAQQGLLARLLSKIRGPAKAARGEDLALAPRRSLLGGLGKLGSIGLLLFSAAGAVFPHLVFEQFKEMTLREHENQMREWENKIAALTQEIARLSAFQRELESYEAQKKMVRERLEVIRNLLAARGTPVNVLDAIAQSLPQRAWVTSLDFDMRQSVVTVNGRALTNEEISDYVDKLSESVYLQDVGLESVTVGKGFESANIDLKFFQLTVIPKEIRGTASVPAEQSAPKGAQSSASGDNSKGGQAQ